MKGTRPNRKTLSEQRPEARDRGLGISGYTFSDLYRPERLRALHQLFVDWLIERDAVVADTYQRYLATKGEEWKPQDVSECLISTARYVHRFIALLFDVEAEDEALQNAIRSQRPVYRMKKDFIQRRVWKKYSGADASSEGFDSLHREVTAFIDAIAEHVVDGESHSALRSVNDRELLTATAIVWLVTLESDTKRATGGADGAEALPDDLSQRWELLRGIVASIDNANALRTTLPAAGDPQDWLTAIGSILERVELWAYQVFFDAKTSSDMRAWASYKFPETLDYVKLVRVNRPKDELGEEMTGPESRMRRRVGFQLTDRRMSQRMRLGEVDYCVFCHDRDKDSCSKGMKEKDGRLKKNPLGIPLTGCPLDEKISEMHSLYSEGWTIGALATIIIDNPMLPGTGHRICNDCMKACIYQKQEPVNIPEVETGVLNEVLALPYGFEIYSFLTRWNPLNVSRPYALPFNGKTVLVVGLGPAGYTLAHYLLNEGFGVVGIDGLKIEPLAPELTGADGACPMPVREFSSIQTELDERIMMGFGGVSEYGITVRWDKNFLTVIYLTLARRSTFKLYGGIRFGGTMTIDDAWQFGFDHIAIATGAGKPTIVSMKNNLSRGIRMASDFLMALQLTGAAKRDSMANLQVQLPAVVIGGGLTAVDTATELLAYYPLQVEKFFMRFEKLSAQLGEDVVWKLYDDEEKAIASRFIEHARALRTERERARTAGEPPNFVPMLRAWGGVRLVYRKGMIDSPAYRLNHEEIIKALEEGISFVENLSPIEAKLDAHGAVEAMVFERQAKDENGKWRDTGEHVTLGARSVMIAAGTSPNTIIERENPGTFRLDKWNQYFLQHVRSEDDETLHESDANRIGFFTSYHRDGKFISYYGDNHPVFAGNVVKAMASARQGYPQIVSLFECEIASLDPAAQQDRDARWNRLVTSLDDAMNATVIEVKRYTPTIVEVVVKARAAAEKFQPGQFYRMQNFEVDAVHIDDTKLAMEGLALTGAWVDKENGLLSMIVLEMGTSSRLCASLAPGQRVVVMGPTGAPTEIPREENVLLAGGGLGNAVLFSIARALRENGCKVLYFAGYKRGEDLYKREEIEASTTQVIWSTDSGASIEPHREQDAHFRGNIVQAIKKYGDDEFGQQLVPLTSISRIIAIGSDRMMAAVKEARTGVLGPYFNLHTAIGSINSPMQCMMKEVCAQCLQRHVDPETGQETGWVFSCFNQDQHLDEVDFKNLNDRLKQNIVLEKLSNAYLDYLLAKKPIALV